MNLHRLPVRPYLSLAAAAFPTRSLLELETRRAEAFNDQYNGRAIVTECTLLLTYTPVMASPTGARWRLHARVARLQQERIPRF